MELTLDQLFADEDAHSLDEGSLHALAHVAMHLRPNATLDRLLWLYRDRVHGPFGIILCLFGVVLNVFSCLIWRKKDVLLTGNVPLVAISVCHTLISLAFLPLLITLYCVTPHSAPKERRNSQSNMLIAIVSNQLQLTAHATILWLGVLMMFQRLICTTTKVPLHQNRLVSRRMTHASISLIVFGVVATSTPSYIVSELTLRSAHGNQSVSQHELCLNISSVLAAANLTRFANYSKVNLNDTLAMLEEPRQAYCRTITHVSSLLLCVYYVMSLRPSLRAPVHWIYVVLHKVLPCVLMMLLSVALVRSLRRLVERRNRLVGSASRSFPADEDCVSSDACECKRSLKTAADSFSVVRLREVNKNVTRMLVVLVTLMVSTQLPPALALVWWTKEYRKFGDAFDAFSMLHNAASFILYCVMSSTFRRQFVAQLRLAARTATCGRLCNEQLIANDRESARLSS